MKISVVKSFNSVFARVAVVVGMLVGAAQAADVTWDASTDRNWTEPDSTSWSGSTYQSGDTAQFLGAGSGTITNDAGGVTPGTVIVNSSANYTFTGGSIGGTGTLTKAGSGTLTLSSANAYSGATYLKEGTLTLSGSGSILNSAITIQGGSISLGNTTAETGSGRVSDSAEITSNGGTITYNNTSGTNVYAEMIGSVALTSGPLNFNLAVNQAGAGSQTLTLGGLTQSGTGTVAFSAASTAPNATKNRILVSGASGAGAGQNLPGGVIIGPWATTGTAANNQNDFAVYDASGYILPANITASDETTWTTAANAYTLSIPAKTAVALTATRNITALKESSSASAASATSGNASITITGGHSFAVGDPVAVSSFGGDLSNFNVGRLYYVASVPGANTVTLAATPGGAAITPGASQTLQITGGLKVDNGINLGTFGILNSGNAPLAIGRTAAGGEITLPAAGAGNLYLITGLSPVTSANSGLNGRISIEAPIVDNGGALTLVKNGAGVLRLQGVNTYTGGTVINAGTVIFTDNNNFGSAATPITFNGSGALSFGPNTSWAFSAGGTITLSRPIALNNGAIAGFYYNSPNTTMNISGAITGDGGITVGKDPVVTYSGGDGSIGINFTSTGHTFTGPLIMLTHGLTFNSLADGTGSMILGANFTYGSGATNNLSVPNRLVDVRGNITIANSAGARTVTLGAVSTTTAGAKTLTLGNAGAGGFVTGAISNGSGSIGVTKSGTGNWILSGTNTYSGSTTISVGTLEVGGSGSLGSGTYTATISNAGTLKFNSSTNQTIGGVISGTGALIKDGAGTLSLTVNNTYSGNTTVSAGTLSLGNGTSNSSLNDYATLSVASGATLDLNYAGADKVLYLNLGGSPAAAGEWGAIGSGAANESALITGTGRINNLDGDVSSLNIGYWDGGITDIGTDGNLASGGGNGTWNTTLMNWDYGFTAHKVWANSPVESAVFAGTAGTVTLGESVSISNLTINSDFYTIRSNTLNFATGGRITVNSANNGNWTTVATIRSAVTGAPSVVLNFGGENTETDFLPTSGSMQLGAKSGNGLIALGGSTTGNTLASASGKIRVSGGEWTLLGNASGYQHFVDGGTLVVNGALSCSDAKGLRVSTNGTLVANGTVGNGSANGINFNGNTEGATTGAGGTLKGTGRVWQSNLLNVRAEATIAPGYPTGTLTVTNCAVTINGKLDITVDGAQNSRLAVSGTNTLTVSSGTLNVNVVSPPAGPFIIATYGALIGQFAVTNGIDTWQVDYNYQGGKAIALIPPASGTLVIVR